LSPEQSTELIARLERAFGSATDVTPAEGGVLHVLLSKLHLPDPWTPTTTRAITIWENWPIERPRFLVDPEVTGDGGEPPRSNDLVYVAGESWRQFSFQFPWKGNDPVLAVQNWLERFYVEPA
jgi:hypothetical protein